MLLWLAEMACIQALAGQLTSTEMTLGISHANSHLAPTPIGASIVVRARLIAVEDRRLRFEVWASDGVDTILRGEHERAIVDRPRFVEKVARKAVAIAELTPLSLAQPA